MKTRNEYQSLKQIGCDARRSRLLQGTLYCAVLMLLWAPISTDGQTNEDQAEEWNCGDCPDCTGNRAAAFVAIDNLTTPKAPDLVLCADDAGPAACMAFWPSNNPQIISGVQDAIVAINTKFTELGRKINVLIDGHGSPGVQCFGRHKWAADAADCGIHPTCNGACPDGEFCREKDTTGNQLPDDCKCAKKECIGNTTDALTAMKTVFVDGSGAKPGAKDKIKNLILLGCSTAADPDGQGFLAKLRRELNADSVKGFTGTNKLTTTVRFSGSLDNCDSDAGAAAVCNGVCPNGEVCRGFPTSAAPDFQRCLCVTNCDRDPGAGAVCNGDCTGAEICSGQDVDGDREDDVCACATVVINESSGYATEGNKKTIKMYTDLVWVWGGPNGVNYTISPGVWTLDGVEQGRTFPDGGKIDAPPNSKRTAKRPIPGKFNDFHFGIDIYTPDGKTPKHLEGSGVWSLTTLAVLGDQIELKAYATTGTNEDTVLVDYDFTSSEADPTIVVDINDVQVYSGAESGFDASGQGLEHVASRFLTIETMCGDGIRDGSEQCDGDDDEKCPGSCLSDCTCAPGTKIPAVSEWGLGVMLLLVLTAGTVVLGRRRYTAA